MLDFDRFIACLNEIAWENTEPRLHIRTGKGDGWKLGRDCGQIFRSRMKRIQAHKVRRISKEIIKEQLAA